MHVARKPVMSESLEIDFSSNGNRKKGDKRQRCNPDLLHIYCMKQKNCLHVSVSRYLVTYEGCKSVSVQTNKNSFASIIKQLRQRKASKQQNTFLSFLSLLCCYRAILSTTQWSVLFVCFVAPLFYNSHVDFWLIHFSLVSL